MNNMDNDKQRRRLEEAEAFLEKMGLTADVETFLAGEGVAKIARNTYEILKKAIGEALDNAPESVKDRAEEVAKQIAEHEEDYLLDVKGTFKLNLTHTLQTLSDYIAVDTMVRTMIIEVLKTDKEGKLHALITDMAMMIVGHIHNDAMEVIYENYVPEGMPEEIADFITNVLGGGSVMIPFEAVFPGAMKDDESDEEEGSEDCQCNCGEDCECKNGGECKKGH